MIVLDASLVLEVFIRTPLGERCFDRIVGVAWHAPHLIDVEFASALRRHVGSGGLTPHIAEEALQDWRSATVERHAHEPFLPRMWELRNSISAYDAVYVALAEILDAPLLTCDGKLSRSHGHRAKIILLEQMA
jgi:predicted nucleic acid-binding protein